MIWSAAFQAGSSFSRRAFSASASSSVCSLTAEAGSLGGSAACVGALHRLTDKAARVGAEAATARAQMGREPLAVPDEPGRPLPHCRLQSAGIAIVIARMSRRSSSAVGRPQYQ